MHVIQKQEENTVNTYPVLHIIIVNHYKEKQYRVVSRAADNVMVVFSFFLFLLNLGECENYQLFILKIVLLFAETQICEVVCLLA